MKHRIIGLIGVFGVLAIVLGESTMLLYNYGCYSMAYSRTWYSYQDFSWDKIDSLDWTMWSLSVAWYIFLVIPWMQYFRFLAKENRYKPTLSGWSGFWSVFYTMFNAAIILGTAALLVPSKGLDELGHVDDFWFYILFCMLAFSSLLYIPWACVVITRNIKHRFPQECIPTKKKHWLISAIPFLIAGVFIFSLWHFTEYEMYDFHQGRAVSHMWKPEGYKYGYLNRFRNEIIPHTYDYAGDFSDGLACVGMKRDGKLKYGYIDRAGDVIIPLEYDSHTPCVDGKVFVKKGDKHGILSRKGNVIVPLIYDEIGIFFPENNGLAIARVDNHYGFIRENGDVVIPFAYDYCESFFSEGLVRARLYGKWGYLDHKGNEIIPFIYDDADLFKDGKVQVQLDTENFYIDRKGQRLEEYIKD